MTVSPAGKNYCSTTKFICIRSEKYFFVLFKYFINLLSMKKCLIAILVMFVSGSVFSALPTGETVKNHYGVLDYSTINTTEVTYALKSENLLSVSIAEFNFNEIDLVLAQTGLIKIENSILTGIQPTILQRNKDPSDGPFNSYFRNSIKLNTDKKNKLEYDSQKHWRTWYLRLRVN